jgi:hypothetical protein
MISLIICGRRAADVDHDYFSAHWRDVHGPLVLGITEFTRHLCSYRQFHVRSDGALVSGTAEDYDGVALLSFPDADAMTAAFGEPRFLSILEPDTGRFLDMAHSLRFVTTAEPSLGALPPNPGSTTIFEFANPGTRSRLEALVHDFDRHQVLGIGQYIALPSEGDATPPTIITTCSFSTQERAKKVMGTLDLQGAKSAGHTPFYVMTREYVFM